MIYETLVEFINEMHDKADELDDDSAKSMMEGHCDHHTAECLRTYANKLTLIMAEDMRNNEI